MIKIMQENWSWSKKENICAILRTLICPEKRRDIAVSAAK
jgi:hypothetical protein